MTTDPYLLVRAATIYLPIIMLAAAWMSRRPDHRALTGAFMSMAWNVPALLAIHLVADRAGWWQFDADGGMLLGFPVDLWLGWALLWGPVPALLFPSAPLAIVVAVGLLVDLILMPAGFPVVRLGDDWLIGEAVALAAALIPAQLLARWTAADRRLRDRALLQVIAFVALLGLVFPAIAIESSHTSWMNPMTYPQWVLGFFIQLLALPALLGFSAVQEFVTRGAGTPVPFDPPRRIVSTGPYAYVSNPMQLSAVLLLLLIGLVIRNPWVAGAGVMGHIYSIGLAGWDEDSDLTTRFGEAWLTYRRQVRSWVPRWRPWYRDHEPVGTLYVSEECDMCREVAEWFRARGARGLVIAPAEDHPRETLTRITYESTEGAYRASGMAAVARGLEHVHLGWAFVGFAIRMPIASTLIQLIADASGAGPRTVRRRAARAECQN
jgi:protein-S-isoprenylcysteine O-methyltransferase Ste14